MKTNFLVLLLLFLLVSQSWAQHASKPNSQPESLPPEGMTLQEGWRFQAGDDPRWASADFPDQT